MRTKTVFVMYRIYHGDMRVQSPIVAAPANDDAHSLICCRRRIGIDLRIYADRRLEWNYRDATSIAIIADLNTNVFKAHISEINVPSQKLPLTASAKISPADTPRNKQD